MFGSTRRHIYMMCQPKAPRADSAGHPGTVSVRHDALMDGLRRFLAEHLLDPTRTERLAVTLRQDDGRLDADRQRRLDQLDRHIHDLNQRRARLISSLETCTEPDPDLIHSVQVRMAELRAQRDDAEADRRRIADRARDEPNPDLIGLLPTGALRSDLPDAAVRELLDLLRLQIRYDRTSRHATYQCTLTAATVPAVADLLRRHVTVVRDRRATPPGALRPDDGTLVITGRCSLDTTRGSYAFPDA